MPRLQLCPQTPDLQPRASLPAHADVALFVLRAVHDLDVLTGDSKQQALQAQQARQAQQAQQVASPRAPAASTPERRQQRVEPTSPRQHLIALL